MFKFEFTRICVAVLLSAGLVSAHAGGGPAGGGATEWTQLANNAELLKVSADSATTAINVVRSYMTQLEQLRQTILNTTGIDPNVVSTNLQDLSTTQTNLSNYRNALQAVTGGLAQETKIIDQRMAEARLQNLSWADYIAQINQDAAIAGGKQKARLAYEQAVLDRVNQDYEFARQQAALIPQTVGAHQAIQLLNTQMNRVVSQNAQMIEILAKAGQPTSAVTVQDAAAKAQSANQLDLYYKRQRAMQKRQDEGLTIAPSQAQ